MKIYIKLATGDKETLTLDVEPSDTIEKIQDIISDKKLFHLMNKD